MSTHLFLLEPGLWKGEGTIRFSMAEDILDFKTRWRVLPREGDKIYCTQEVEVVSFPSTHRNYFCMTNITDTRFDVLLENETVGKVMGKGVISPKSIAWEFKQNGEGFEGFEIFELQEDGSYAVRAEFYSGDEFRTHINATLIK